MKDIFHYEKDIQVQDHQQQLIEKAAHWQLEQAAGSHRAAPVNRIICHLLCGLGHRLVRWGRYLEQHFTLPEDQPLTPRRL